MFKNKFLGLLAICTLLTSIFTAGMSAFPGNTKAASGFYDSLDTFNQSLWHKADGWSNGDMFNTTWYGEQITFSNGEMRFSIDKEEEGTSPPFKGAEYRTNDSYGYGLYEVSMKPAKKIGIVSSFFTYTGPSEDNPWDEIDIEFLGKDTTKIQFNYFTNGKGNNEFYYDLGYDASLSYNVYAFEWRPDSITWYVNGDPVHVATENIPNNPGKIMMNLWPGIGVDSWLGKFDGETPVHSFYDWVRFTPIDQLEGKPPVTEQPGDGEEQPGDGEEPGDGGEQPGDGEEQPGNGEEQPGNGEEQPGDGEEQPGDGEEQPGDGEEQPGDGEEQPGDGEEQPGDGEEQPQDEVEQDGNKNETKNPKGNTGEKLPNTATSVYNYLLFGTLTLLVGTYMYFMRKRKENRN